MQRLDTGILQDFVEELMSCPESQEMFLYEPLFSQMIEFAQINNIPIIDKQNGFFLHKVVEFLKPKTILEIGTGLGFSTRILALTMYSEGFIISVDLSFPSILRARNFLKKEGVSFEKILLVNAEGKEFFDSLTPCFDLIFIDCCKDDYPFYLENYKKRLNPGGVVIFDDVLLAGSKRESLGSHKYEKIEKKLKIFREKLNIISSSSLFQTSFGDGLAIIFENSDGKI